MTQSFHISDAQLANMQEQKERDQRWCDAQREVINAVFDGVRPHACPWEDKRFQELILHALVKAGKWRRDAEKLTVIREVFGSKS